MFWSVEEFAINKGDDGKSVHILRSGEVILADTWFLKLILTKAACFVAFWTCIVHLPWPRRSAIHLKVKTGDVVQTFKVKLGGHCACDFRHIPILLKTWIFWALSYLGCHQPFSKQCLLADGSCNHMTSRSPLVTIKLLDNKIVLDVSRKRIRAVVNCSCYIYVNTTSEVKTYLDKSTQLATWLQVSPKVPGPDWFSGLFSWIPQGMRFLLYKTQIQDLELENISSSVSIPQIKVGLRPISAGSSQSGNHPIPWKNWGRMKQDWSLKPNHCETEFLCWVYD